MSLLTLVMIIRRFVNKLKASVEARRRREFHERFFGLIEGVNLRLFRDRDFRLGGAFTFKPTYASVKHKYALPIKRRRE